MKRRDYLINNGLSVDANSASSFIKFDRKHFIGSCEKTHLNNLENLPEVMPRYNLKYYLLKTLNKQ